MVNLLKLKLWVFIMSNSITGFLRRAINDKKSKKTTIRANKIRSIIETFNISNLECPGQYPFTLHVDEDRTMKIYQPECGDYKMVHVSSKELDIFRIIKRTSEHCSELTVYSYLHANGIVKESYHPLLKNSITPFIDSLFDLMSSSESAMKNNQFTA